MSEAWPEFRRPRPGRRLSAVSALTWANLIVFALEVVHAQGPRALFPGVPAPVLVALGANHAPSVAAGEIWRLLMESRWSSSVTRFWMNSPPGI